MMANEADLCTINWVLITRYNRGGTLERDARQLQISIKHPTFNFHFFPLHPERPTSSNSLFIQPCLIPKAEQDSTQQTLKLSSVHYSSKFRFPLALTQYSLHILENVCLQTRYVWKTSQKISQGSRVVLYSQSTLATPGSPFHSNLVNANLLISRWSEGTRTVRQNNRTCISAMLWFRSGPC